MTDIIGHDIQWTEVMQAASGERMHHGWLLTGPEGIGKASFAREVALSLLAGEGRAISPDHPTAKLVMAGAHPDYADLSRLEKDNGELARNITVDQVRSLHRLLESAPSISQHRVIVIDSADDLERGGANALLKNLEEPPRNVVFLLVSHSPSRLLPTIRSRCRLLRFSALDDGSMRRVITEQKPTIDGNDLDQLVANGKGAPGRALALAGLGLDDMRRALDRIYETGDVDNRERLALAKSLSLKSGKDQYQAALKLIPDYLADKARALPVGETGPILQSWEKSRDLASGAIILSLDPASTIFELCGIVASLATTQAA
jgi:DNA polymerase III subunit delta'